uniref:Uncharacterized protein n=1 Tax=Glossina pallidipes TaxID=7398 RepID=A0A1B0AJ28_GLOPL
MKTTLDHSSKVELAEHKLISHDFPANALEPVLEIEFIAKCLSNVTFQFLLEYEKSMQWSFLHNSFEIFFARYTCSIPVTQSLSYPLHAMMLQSLHSERRDPISCILVSFSAILLLAINFRFLLRAEIPDTAILEPKAESPYAVKPSCKAEAGVETNFSEISHN